MYSKILVGTDGSGTAAIAVARAVQVAKATGAALTILSVGKEHQARLIAQGAASDHLTAGIDIHTEALDGDPAQVLVERADAGQFDLLVVGNKGMQGISRFFGSVPNSVSHGSPCALLIVRTT